MTLAFLIRDLSGDAGRLRARGASLVGHLTLGMMGKILCARQAQRVNVAGGNSQAQKEIIPFGSQTTLFADKSWFQQKVEERGLRVWNLISG